MMARLKEFPKMMSQKESSGELSSRSSVSSLQRSRRLLVKLGLLGSQSRVPRQNHKSKGLLVKLGLLGSAQHSTTAEAASGEAGPSWHRAYDMDSAVGSAAVKLAGKARPPEPELAKSSDEIGPEQMVAVPPLQQL